MSELQTIIEAKLVEALQPERMEIFNDSRRHSRPGTDSHFRVILVSDLFEGKNLVARQRLVFSALAFELAGPVHALQMRCMTPAEYREADEEVRLVAPPCSGAPKA